MANRITTIFDFSERGGGLKKIKADMAEVDGSINKAKTGVKGLWAEFKNNRVAQAAVAGIVAKLGTDAVNAASNLQESVNAVNTTFGESSDEIAKLTESAVDNYGMSERAFNNMSVALSGFAGQVAGDGGDVAGVIDDMATRIADFSSVHNLATQDAMVKFQGALAGEAEAMRRYGIDVSAATVKTHAYEKGIADVGRELTESEKVQARYSLLMQETDQWAGDFANTSESLANQQRRLAAEVENAQAKIGAALVPVVEAATGAMIDLAEGVGDVDNAIKNMSGGTEDLGSVLGAVFKAGSAPFRGLMAYNEGFLDLVGLSGEAEESLDGMYESTRRGGRKVDEARQAQREFAEELRESAKESTYNADANEEMGRIQRLTTDAVDAARRAQERFLQAIKFTRDEVGALQRQIDDRQGWLDLADAIEHTKTTMNDAEASANDQERAMLNLKEEVIRYGQEVGDLPDRVVTDILSLIDQGKLAEAEAALERLERARTINYIPVVQAPRTSGGQRFMASGGISPGGPTVVGERGPELVDMPRGARVRSAVETVTDTRSTGRGGNTYVANFTVQGQLLDQRGVAMLKQMLDDWERGQR